ncbi:MAG: sigma-70 family RNA polymerase sigma factor [Verrucomicrobia bacterium]|nr:sigma-70 family RNA polymerase sigma factor [Verrucomicrobiota bacterium]
MNDPPEEFIPTRRTLLSRLKDWNDEKSWREFFNTYWKLIYGVAIKAGLNDTEAQEVVQETVITVAKKMPGFKYDPALGSFKGWLLHITRWRINDQLRKRQRANQGQGKRPGETTTTSDIKRIPDPSSIDLDAVWEQDWEKNLMDAAIDRVKRQVDPKQYQMFDLHVIKEWPARKTAQKLHTSLAKVYYAKYKIAALIRKETKHLEKKLV